MLSSIEQLFLFEFTGYQLDGLSGLCHAQARQYDPATSRMAASDPWKGSMRLPQTLNRYSYCLDAPLAFVDSSDVVPGRGLPPG
jgi:RHS repeat-associated protein